MSTPQIAAWKGELALAERSIRNAERNNKRARVGRISREHAEVAAWWKERVKSIKAILRDLGWVDAR